jgi:hypothetical protein
VPFASSHYYRAPDSLEQNLSLLGFDELERWGSGDPRLLVLRIGDAVEIDEQTWHTRWQRRTPALGPVDLDVLAYTTRVGWDELLATANAHCAKLKVAFPVLSRATGALRVWVHDHGRGLSLDCHAGARELPDAQCDIAASSQPLHDWLGRAFGADTFFAGAHFGLRNEDTRAIERWALLTLLDASHLTERDALRYLGSREGRAFLWARREEIVATLGSGRVRAARMRI